MSDIPAQMSPMGITGKCRDERLWRTALHTYSSLGTIENFVS